MNSTLKYANTAEIGDYIKAFDFQPMEGREDAYLIGKVVKKGAFYQEIEDGQKVYLCDGYTVEVTKSPGFESRVGETMCVPFESTFDYDGRVTLYKKAGPSDEELAEIGKRIVAQAQARAKRSKKEKAQDLFDQYADKGRKFVIERFMEVLDMSKAGASTYYYNCKKWSV